jgi:Skp family chaperone for outer membrane proteins
MAVKVCCSICDTFIKDVLENEIGKLNGREICDECGRKVSTVLKQLDDLEKKHVDEIQKAHAKAVQRYKKLDTDYRKFMTDSKDLYFRARQELNDTLKDILER